LHLLLDVSKYLHIYRAIGLQGPFLQGAVGAVETHRRGFLEGVLPDADDFPPPAPELEVHAAIASHIVFAFFIPKVAA
jgi:hypothetical protein